EAGLPWDVLTVKQRLGKDWGHYLQRIEKILWGQFSPATPHNFMRLCTRLIILLFLAFKENNDH
ncbi:MAG TPA: hypothetical protein DCS09_10640, partial [Porphyromonadaceae bacterium]|nr:hypothetical protein [Porphyromonadaceae bacterium]